MRWRAPAVGRFVPSETLAGALLQKSIKCHWGGRGDNSLDFYGFQEQTGGKDNTIVGCGTGDAFFSKRRFYFERLRVDVTESFALA